MSPQQNWWSTPLSVTNSFNRYSNVIPIVTVFNNFKARVKQIQIDNKWIVMIWLRTSVRCMSPCWQRLGYWPGAGGWCPHSAPLCPRAGPECGRCRNSPGKAGGEGQVRHAQQDMKEWRGNMELWSGGSERRQRRKHLGIQAVRALTGHFVGSAVERELSNRQERGS